MAFLLLLSLITRPALADEPPATSLEGAVSTEASSGSGETSTEADAGEESAASSESSEETTPEETKPPTPDVPKTGDKNPLLLWCTLLAVSGSSMIVLAVRRRKTGEE